MIELCCLNCLCFDAIPDKRNAGLCRRYAGRPMVAIPNGPQVGARNVHRVTLWPEVLQTDWCAEFMPNENSLTEAKEEEVAP